MEHVKESTERTNNKKKVAPRRKEQLDEWDDCWNVSCRMAAIQQITSIDEKWSLSRHDDWSRSGACEDEQGSTMPGMTDWSNKM